MDSLSKIEENNTTIEEVIEAIKKIRISVIKEEFDLHKHIKETLNLNNISFHYEYKLGPHRRIDFLTSNGVGIEAKKGKPNYTQTIKQLEKYAQSEEVKVIILVIERYMDLPSEIYGKPCYSIGLNRLWGISL